EQVASFIVPQTTNGLIGSPQAGLTNQQNWNRVGIAIAGAMAPSNATTRTGIHGLVVGPSSGAPPIAPTIGAQASSASGTSDTRVQRTTESDIPMTASVPMSLTSNRSRAHEARFLSSGLDLDAMAQGVSSASGSRSRANLRGSSNARLGVVAG